MRGTGRSNRGLGGLHFPGCRDGFFGGQQNQFADCKCRQRTNASFERNHHLSWLGLQYRLINFIGLRVVWAATGHSRHGLRIGATVQDLRLAATFYGTGLLATSRGHESTNRTAWVVGIARKPVPRLGRPIQRLAGARLQVDPSRNHICPPVRSFQPTTLRRHRRVRRDGRISLSGEGQFLFHADDAVRASLDRLLGQALAQSGGLALHAEGGQKMALDRRELADVAVEHLGSEAAEWYAIFRLARHRAGVAAGTTLDIDCQSPLLHGFMLSPQPESRRRAWRLFFFACPITSASQPSRPLSRYRRSFSFLVGMNWDV